MVHTTNTGGEGLRLGLSYHYAVLWYRFSHQPAEVQRATVQPTPGAAHPWIHILDHTVSLESTEFKKNTNTAVITNVRF